MFSKIAVILKFKFLIQKKKCIGYIRKTGCEHGFSQDRQYSETKNILNILSSTCIRTWI